LQEEFVSLAELNARQEKKAAGGVAITFHEAPKREEKPKEIPAQGNPQPEVPTENATVPEAEEPAIKDQGPIAESNPAKLNDGLFSFDDSLMSMLPNNCQSGSKGRVSVKFGQPRQPNQGTIGMVQQKPNATRMPPRQTFERGFIRILEKAKAAKLSVMQQKPNSQKGRGVLRRVRKMPHEFFPNGAKSVVLVPGAPNTILRPVRPITPKRSGPVTPNTRVIVPKKPFNLGPQQSMERGREFGASHESVHH
jgi:hypothetical protein